MLQAIRTLVLESPVFGAAKPGRHRPSLRQTLDGAGSDCTGSRQVMVERPPHFAGN